MTTIMKPQVALFLTWASFVAANGHATPHAVWFSLDESALQHYVGGRHGNQLFVPQKRRSFGTKAPLGSARAMTTLVATVCTDPVLQQHLPQYLVGRDTGKKRKWRAAEAALPADTTMRILAGDSGWVNIAKMLIMLDGLHAACETHIPGRPKVMVWDCALPYTAPRVLARARKHGFTVLVVPAKVTSVLQVLDVGVFSVLKQRLYAARTQRFIESGDGAQDFT